MILFYYKDCQKNGVQQQVSGYGGVPPAPKSPSRVRYGDFADLRYVS